MPNRERQDPISMLNRVLQMQQFMRDLEFGPEEDVLRYEKLLSRDTPDAETTAERYLSSSRIPKERAQSIKSEFGKREAEAAQADLDDLLERFEMAEEQAIAKAQRIASTVQGADYQATLLSEMDRLGQKRENALKQFQLRHRRAFSNADIRQSFQDAGSLFGRQGTLFNAMEIIRGGGTPKDMAPEVPRYGSYDKRSDDYPALPDPSPPLTGRQLREEQKGLAIRAQGARPLWEESRPASIMTTPAGPPRPTGPLAVPPAQVRPQTPLMQALEDPETAYRGWGVAPDSPMPGVNIQRPRQPLDPSQPWYDPYWQQRLFGR